MHTGEVGIEITPVFAAPSLESKVAAQLDALLRRTCQIARALTGAEQAALKLWVGEDSSQARKYFSLSEKYAEFRDFRVDPKGIGLHGMPIPPGQVIRLTEAEVLSHPLYGGFGSLAGAHPPLRGWLATSVCGDDGRIYGLLQLSDKSGGGDFDQADETNIRELAALIGEALDAVRLAAAMNDSVGPMTEMSRNVPAAGRGRLTEVLASRGGKAAPEAPFVIEHREALIYMLYEAAELEHGIMCQYLFAAFSLKQREDEGLTADGLEAVRRWRRAVAHVATDEMLHLALVQNLLSAIGSAPHLARPNLPAPARHYPAGVNLTLVPFGESALRHFMFLERPEGMELEGAEGIDAPVHEAVPLLAEGDIVPQPQDFATIGHLYRSIECGFDHLAEKFGEQNLFVGPPRAQATRDYFNWPELVPVTDLASAHRAIDTILEQGEGARGHWQNAHFGQFVRILDEYRQLKAAHPDFEPVRPVLFATVRPSEHDDTVPRITDRVTSGCTDLFNVGYEILLHVLQRYFAHTEETDAQLATLSRTAIALMVGVLKPLGDLITTLPVGPEHPGMTANASFELFYVNDYLVPHREAAWAVLEERLRDAETFCDRIRTSGDQRVATELEKIRTALTGVADSLAAHFGDWGAVSRFAASETAKETTPASDAVLNRKEQMADQVTYERNIRQLFRDRDIQSMKFAFDLSSYDDVRANAEAIYERLAAGSMPCDGPWPAEDVERFRTWIDSGSPP